MKLWFHIAYLVNGQPCFYVKQLEHQLWTTQKAKCKICFDEIHFLELCLSKVRMLACFLTMFWVVNHQLYLEHNFVIFNPADLEVFTEVLLLPKQIGHHLLEIGIRGQRDTRRTPNSCLGAATKLYWGIQLYPVLQMVLWHNWECHRRGQ